MTNSTTTAINNFISNSPFNESSSITLSVDEFLKQLGFEMWTSIINTFILPPINVMGVVFCSFSLWVFSRPSFEDPIFFYYKLLSFINIIYLLHNIPKCILYSPFYFPGINTYFVSIYMMYYNSVSNVLFHFADVLQMGIVLHKMKLFIPFVQKYYSASPQKVSLAFFLTCLLIDLPVALAFRIISFGNYYYFDWNGLKQINTFYYVSSSDFSQTLLGKILLGFTGFFLNLILSLSVGIILNILSYIKYKSYMSRRKREVEELQMSSIHNRPTTNREIEQLKHREKTERQIERNMFYMSLTLCSISIITRFLITTLGVYFFFFFSFRSTLISIFLSNVIYTIGPTVSIFVFYFFNKMFRDETNKKLFAKKPRPSPRIIFISNDVRF